MAGTTSRTLRHYDDIGLLKPSRVGSNGYRYYDAAALLQLQRILLLRELGLGLPAIAEVFRRQTDAVEALSHHLEWLGQEQDRLSRQMASVRQTIETMKGGGEVAAERCSTVSTTHSTRMRWKSAGARMPTQRATPGGGTWMQQGTRSGRPLPKARQRLDRRGRFRGRPGWS